MTSLTLSAARDSIQQTFYVPWAALSPAAAGLATPVRVEWDGVDDGTQRDPQQPYAAVFIRHLNSDQTTLAGADGTRRFTRKGVVTVQVFAPLANRGGLSLAENLATIARDAYEGVDTADGIWYQKVTTKEMGSDGRGFYQLNVIANFQYDEVK